MKSAMAIAQANPLFMSQPISSAYLVMLRRYLNFRHQNSRPKLALGESGQADYYVESTISLQKIVPLLDDIADLVGHKAVGLDIGRHMHPSDYGVFGYALMNCATLYEALHTAAKYKRILNQNLVASFKPDHREEQGTMVYRMDTCFDSDTLDIMVELDFSTAFQFGKLLVGPHKEDELNLTSVHFRHSPNGPITLYEERFECPVFFNAPYNALKLSPKMLDTPIYAANNQILGVLEEQIQQILNSYNKTNNRKNNQDITKEAFSTAVANYIETQLGQSIPSANQAAKVFNMSLSTLKKRLKEEQTCYQEISDQVRYKKCLTLMRNHNMALKQIAFDLGFANPSAFNRAFKRWTGQSPASYRNGLES